MRVPYTLRHPVKTVRGELIEAAHHRFHERIVVLESDDWGMVRTPCSHLLAPFGEPTEWAEESLETVEDMERLFDVLSSVRDETDRPACITANVVLEHPDLAAMERDLFRAWHGLDIRSYPALLESYVRGQRQRVFLPQLHARYHLGAQKWLSDLRSGDPCATALARLGVASGRSFLKGQGWHYHSEYCDWSTGKIPEQPALQRHIEESQALFHAIFGYESRSTIPPHYIHPQGLYHACRRAGISTIQGGNHCFFVLRNGRKVRRTHYLGEPVDNGILMSNRTVRFEPRPSRELTQGLVQAREKLVYCFSRSIPAIIDTHRINYTGKFRDPALHALRMLLDTAAGFSPRFLTTTELSEAIASGGRYRDHWTGMEHQLTPVLGMKGRISRTILKDLHVRRTY